jgi:hypothetical protein
LRIGLEHTEQSAREGLKSRRCDLISRWQGHASCQDRDVTRFGIDTQQPVVGPHKVSAAI